MRFSFSFTSSIWSSPASLPPPPPPTPNDNLLDINPRKSSFSTTFERHNSCAFPSWPNRPSLLSSQESESSTATSYLSDEDLFFDDMASPSEAVVDEEPAPQQPFLAEPGLTTEQQIQMMRLVDEEQQRLRFLAQVHAHARAHQQLRAAQMAAAEGDNAKRKKRKPLSDKKRRAVCSSSSSSSKSTPCDRS